MIEPHTLYIAAIIIYLILNVSLQMVLSNRIVRLTDRLNKLATAIGYQYSEEQKVYEPDV